MFTSVVVVLLLTTLSVADDDVHVPQHPFRVVCHMAFEDSDATEPYSEFTVSNAEPALPMCTHLVYNYLHIKDSSFKVYSRNPTLDFGDGGIKRMVAFKKKFPYLKTMIGVGGMNDNSTYYSKMASRPETRSTFIDSVVTFVLDHGLDGMDFYWLNPGEFPGNDKANFVQLVKELRQQFDKHFLILSLTLTGTVQDSILGVEPTSLGQHAHFLNIQTFFVPSQISEITAHSPAHSKSDMGFVSTLNFYVRSGVPPHKMNFGISNSNIFYFLADKNATGNGVGMLFRDRQYLTNRMFCRLIDYIHFEEEWDDVSQTPFSRSGEYVVSHENARSVLYKTEYAISVMELGGMALHGLDGDDYEEHCAATEGKYQMLRQIEESLVHVTERTYTELSKSIDSYNARYFWNAENRTTWSEDEKNLGWIEN